MIYGLLIIGKMEIYTSFYWITDVGRWRLNNINILEYLQSINMKFLGQKNLVAQNYSIKLEISLRNTRFYTTELRINKN